MLLVLQRVLMLLVLQRVRMLRLLLLVIGPHRLLVLRHRRRWWWLLLVVGLHLLLVLLWRWWLLLFLVVVVAVVVVVVASVLGGGIGVGATGKQDIVVCSGGGSGGGGDVCLTIRVRPRRLLSSRDGGGAPRARLRRSGGQRVSYTYSPRAVLMHVPQLVAVLAPLARVSAMHRRLVTKRTGDVRRVPGVIVAATGGGVRWQTSTSTPNRWCITTDIPSTASPAAGSSASTAPLLWSSAPTTTPATAGMLVVLLWLLLWLLLLLLLLLWLLLLLLLLLLWLLLLLLALVVVSPAPATASSSSSSPAILTTPVTSTRPVWGNEGVSRPVPLLLLPRHLHLSESVEHHIFEDFARQICVREQNALLNSESRGKVAGKMLVSLYIKK